MHASDALPIESDKVFTVGDVVTDVLVASGACGLEVSEIEWYIL